MVWALILISGMLGFVPASWAGEDGDLNSEFERARRQQVVDPEVVQPGDDDQPTIIGPRSGRRVISATGPNITSTSQAEPDPAAARNGMPLRLYVTVVLLRLGVMLR
jgi:hypothetical protein